MPWKRFGTHVSPALTILAPSDIRPASFACLCVDEARGDSTCSGCGQILDTRLVDDTHDWRNFADSDQDNARASSVDPYSGGQMTTRFAVGNSKQSQSLAWSHNKVNLDTTTKNLMEANSVISSLGNSLNLTPHIQSKARELYKEYERVRVASQRKATHRPLMVAIIYIACNQEGFGRPFKELSKTTGVPEKEIRSFYKSLLKMLPSATVPPIDVSSLVDRFCARLHDDLPEWVKIGAAGIAKKAASVIEGRQPTTIAAGSILLACSLAGIPMNEETIAHATTTISGSTVHSAFVALAQHKLQIVPSEFITRLQQKKGAAGAGDGAKASSSSSSSSSFSSSAPSSSSTPHTAIGPTGATKASMLSPASSSASNSMHTSTLSTVPGVIPAHYTIVKAETSSAPTNSYTPTATFAIPTAQLPKPSPAPSKPAPLASNGIIMPQVKVKTETV